MSNPLVELYKKYFKRPDCWRSLLVLGGVLIVDKIILDYQVKNYIFGPDGKGGEILVIYSRHDHHEEEFREQRKKYYWHQRIREFYPPEGYSLNTKLDYKTLSYNNSHLDTFLDPSKLPSGHDADHYTFHIVSTDNFK
jgi:hypothetical protein